MKSFHLLILSVLSGLLLSLAWPMHGFPPLLFAAFVPLLFIEEYLRSRKNHNTVFTIAHYVFPAFLIWNLLTTWWIFHSTPVGALLAVVLNSIFMTLTFLMFHLTRRIFNDDTKGYLSLIFYWISFEFIHHHWDLNWPWLSLGNGFSAYPKWIQWYEYTGIFGGSLWILIINILLFQSIKYLKKKYTLRGLALRGSFILPAILLPIVISFIIYSSWEHDDGKQVDIVVVQPNLDPYLEQYELDPLEVVDRNWNLALQKLDGNVDFIVCPESAIQEYIWEHELYESRSIQRFREYLTAYPRASIVIGLSSRKIYWPGETPSATARNPYNSDLFYDAYNTAILIDTSESFQLYHKSKLTPGVEVMPLTRYLKFIEKLAIDLGGTVGSLGIDQQRTPFITAGRLKTGTAICYESVYGEFMTGFVKNGADIIFVITNDGWWENTPGHRQHLLFSSVRAIETRRSIARSANTGISCFINERGDIMQATEYWTPGVIRQTLQTGTKQTFYVRFGDYIARISAFGAVLMVLLTLMISIKNKKYKSDFKGNF